MKIIKLLAIGIMMIISNVGYAQCENWNQLANADEVQDAYVLYRDYFRQGNYEQALPHWKIVYENSHRSLTRHHRGHHRSGCRSEKVSRKEQAGRGKA